MFEPIFLEPVYKDIIWGGTQFKSLFNRNLSSDTTAESWEVCAHKNGTNIIKNGEFKGRTLEDLFNDNKYKQFVFGNSCKHLDRFPILVKFIDANDKLSIQVHPQDSYAILNENDLGKTELWYVLDCKPDSKLIYGTKNNIKKEDFRKAIENNDLEDYINYQNISKGDVIFIPSGTLHAILEGIVICEIQQNSDVTYRVYDWGRIDKNGVPRQLHVDKALDVINFNFSQSIIHTANDITKRVTLCDCKYFKTDKISVDTSYLDNTSEDSFVSYTVIKGTGNLIIGGSYYSLSSGTSFIIPANTENYEINGTLELLKTWI